MNKFFQFIMRYLGFLLINFGITLIFFLFFANLSLQETDVLRQELNNYAAQQNVSFAQDPLAQFSEQTTLFRNYFFGGILVIIAFIFLGLIFMIFGTSSIIEAFYKISLTLSLQSFFAAFYYKALPNIVRFFINRNPNLIQNIPQDLYDSLLNILFNWLARPLIKTFTLAIIFGAVFLVIAVILARLKRKTLKEANKA